MADSKSKPAVSYPYRGSTDASWPICGTCQGFGQITQEVALALNQAGKPLIKGTACPTCNGVGRAPDQSWPPCPEKCAGRDDGGALCSGEGHVCGGLGLLSPERATRLEKGEILVPGLVPGLVPYGAKKKKTATPEAP
jgi:hypothetical protein